jgi:aspartyl-tRNA(Asn)/glutamyl-tRNA(Gln) amidotransferase subunit C
MTQISDDTVLHLAHLSKLQLGDDEVSALAADISAILGYVEQLDELDTEGVEPTYQVTGLQNIWRSDEVGAARNVRETLLALAPEQLDNQVKVPKVL